MKTKNFTGQYPNWSGLYHALLPVVTIFLIALSSTSCYGSKKMVQSQSVIKDSVQVKETKRVEYEPIPESKVQLAIPVNDISLLPPKASFTGKDGQANVKVRIENDTIYVDAACDSLSRRVEFYEMELNRARSETETRLKIEEKNAVQTMFKWCLIGVLIGFILTIIITKIIKK